MSGKPDKSAGRAKVIFVKKKAKGHAHHGGAWKVAYADFVTAMMALFMVLWLVSQTDESTQSELSRYFRTGAFSGSGHVIGDTVPFGRGPTVGGGQSQLAGQRDAASARQLEATAQALEQVLDLVAADDPNLASLRDQIAVSLDESGLLIQISDGGDGILFDLASSALTPALEQFLAVLGPVLGRLGNQLQIHGHTDARPFPPGATYDNWDLSFARADAARRFLDGHGVRPRQIVGVLAHADSDLLFPEDPLDPRTRRLSILAVRAGAERPAAHGRATVEGDPERPAAEAARAALEALNGAPASEQANPGAPEGGRPGASEGSSPDATSPPEAPPVVVEPTAAQPSEARAGVVEGSPAAAGGVPAEPGSVSIPTGIDPPPLDLPAPGAPGREEP
jgi:chemotaxis protein MotB